MEGDGPVWEAAERLVVMGPVRKEMGTSSLRKKRSKAWPSALCEAAAMVTLCWDGYS